ncbi:MAG: zinc ribbon domain-containing protein [Chloroflexi bacterium]|nr:zinc ribbon domain-containing protein [Chloroflexota bacterium]
MPILEYACHACGSHFDKLVRSVSAPTSVVCPSCGAMDVERLLSAFAVAGAERRSAPSINFPGAAARRSAFS